MFLDDGLSDDEEEGGAGGTNGGFHQNAQRGRSSERKGDNRTETERTPSNSPPVRTSDDSWMCPLTFEDLPPSPGLPKPAIKSAKYPSVTLKLRRMFGRGREKAHYRAVLDGAAPSPPDPGPLLWRRARGFLHPRCSSQSNRLSFLKVKRRPYRSVRCGGGGSATASHHGRALHQAVRRAKAAGRLRYPDLVGKRIRHLYEEDDKSEVWYRGEVLRVHEAHSDPLKTVFEVRYDSEPEWRYYLELLIDYEKGWLKIQE